MKLIDIIQKTKVKHGDFMFDDEMKNKILEGETLTILKNTNNFMQPYYGNYEKQKVETVEIDIEKLLECEAEYKSIDFTKEELYAIKKNLFPHDEYDRDILNNVYKKIEKYLWEDK